MKIQEMASHIKIKPRDYGHYMSIMANDGGQAFSVTTCKEEMFHCLGKAVGWDYDEDLGDCIMGPSIENDIDLDNPTIFYYVNSSFKKRKKKSRALRILRVLTMLAESQGCKPPIVMVDFSKIDETRANNLIAVEVDKFYFNSPLALSGLLTFLRAAVKTSFVFGSLNNFVAKLVSDKNEDARADKQHLLRARYNGILDRFLSRTLPIFSLSPKKAFRLGKNTSSICYYGIAEHTSIQDMNVIEEDDIYSW